MKHVTIDELQAGLTWENIHAWANACPDDSPIGDVAAHNICPVARFLGHFWPGSTWSVWSDTISKTDSPLMGIPTPTWLSDVIRSVDLCGESTISRQDFLSILEQHKSESLAAMPDCKENEMSNYPFCAEHYAAHVENMKGWEGK